MSNEQWLANESLELFGDKDKNTLDYLKSIAKTAKSLAALHNSLEEFDLPIKDNPRNE